MVTEHTFYCVGCDERMTLGSSMDGEDMTVYCPGCQREMGYVPPDVDLPTDA